jgi:adenylate cyclase
MNKAAPAARRPRRPLLLKYLTALFAAVVVPLLANAAIEAWFGYSEQRTSISRRLRAEAASSAGKIQAFLDDITNQLQWTVQLPWREGLEERHRFDALRLMRQAPAVVEVMLIDDSGAERLHLSRMAPDIVESKSDRAEDPAVVGARATRLWYGPVTLFDGSEPHMTIAVAGPRVSNGVTVAVINLKLIWDVISAIQVGQSGNAFVLDQSGRLVAHPDINLVLRGDDDPAVARLREVQRAAVAGRGETDTATNAEGRAVLAAAAPIPGPDWTAFVEQPAAEALMPVYAALLRTGFLLATGEVFAALLAYLLARRMVGPIRVLEQGAEQIGAGNFDHRIAIATGDELERLAQRFNGMAGELALSQERSERIARLKRFLSPQIAELVEDSNEALLDSHRTEVVVLFCDLRGFTGFAGAAGPEAAVLRGTRPDHHALRSHPDLLHGRWADVTAERARAVPRSGSARGAHGARYAGRSADPDRRLAQQRLCYRVRDRPRQGTVYGWPHRLRRALRLHRYRQHREPGVAHLRCRRGWSDADRPSRRGGDRRRAGVDPARHSPISRFC